MKVWFSRQALDDLEAISAYYRTISPHLANAIVFQIERRIGQLSKYPLIAPETDEPGIRELIVLRYPYKVYYRIDDRGLEIIHVRDARRRPWRNTS